MSLLETATVGLLGIVAGTIFLFDVISYGRIPNAPLWKRRRVRGAITVLVGLLLLVVVTQLLNVSPTNTRDAVVLYLFTFLSFTFFSFVFVGLYGFFSSLRYLQDSRPARTQRYDALEYVFVIWKDGLKAFHDRRSDIEARYLNRFLNFQTTFLDALLPSNRSKKSVEAFVAFVEFQLKTFLLEFWEGAERNQLSKYRACVYFLPENSVELTYLAGVFPPNRPYTQAPLELEKSTAGYALMHPTKVHATPSDRTPGDMPPYNPRESSEEYKSIACRVIQRLTAPRDEKPYLVLTIDCLDGSLDRLTSYSMNMIARMALLLAHAQLVIGISQHDLDAYIAKRDQSKDVKRAGQ